MISALPAEVEHWWQQLRDFGAYRCKDIRAVAHRVWDIHSLMIPKQGPKVGKFFQLLWTIRANKLRRLVECECLFELARGKLEYRIAMRPRHGENEIGICGNPRGQLSRREASTVATQFTEDKRRLVVDRVRRNRPSPGARRNKIWQLTFSRVGTRKTLCNRRTADVPSAHEKYSQSNSSFRRITVVPTL